MVLRAGIILLGCILLLAGCTRQQLQQGIYQGVKTKQELERNPGDQLSEPMPSYDQYEEERQGGAESENIERMP